MAVVAGAAIAVRAGLRDESTDVARPVTSAYQALSARPDSYLGVYVPAASSLYSGPASFTHVTGVTPQIVMYYSGWQEQFRTGFARLAARHGAVPLVQMDPVGVNLASIASGRYDGYLSAFAEAVRSYRGAVILSFGHEMNGSWYSWGYGHTSPAVFVAAWRHIVSLFRALGARNVTWLWTVNIINDTRTGTIPSPSRWWPGNLYVNWVGIDGYYLKPTWQFAPLFGPTIAAVRELTGAPILIAETGAVAAANQPAKITDLFSGIHQYGLLGFVWFDSTNSIDQDFSINTPAALAAFRKGASSYTRPGS